jgi:hypothetical protein
MLYKLTKEEAVDASKVDAVRQVGRADTFGSLLRTPGSIPLSRANTKLSSDDGSDSETEDEADLESYVKDGKVLMVDQLWLWAIDTSEWSGPGRQHMLTSYQSYAFDVFLKARVPSAGRTAVPASGFEKQRLQRTEW